MQKTALIKSTIFVIVFIIISTEMQHLILANIDSRIHYGEETIINLESTAKMTTNGEFSCSSVIIGEDLVLTATHCFTAFLEDGPLNVHKIETLCNGEMTTFNFDMSTLLIQKYPDGRVRKDRSHDIAVIRTTEKFTKCAENKIAKVSCKMAQEGGRMYVAGFGFDENGNSGNLEYFAVTIELDGISSYYLYDFIGPNANRIDTGDSGGPCFDEEWHVIGVVRGWKPDLTKAICSPLWPFYYEYFLG